ncbi:hypothetical protein PHISCL_09790 [Aspergillus sclerotialis]|uniref:Uncharacterized protein n=1 Tax=Aspergillus sclerotialis TaxID=2070753 RepID=A0A3A2ZL40_9EURO|nr:hypothetical protein PHISCL_09790 [Aspergillus sclerotialis]
MEENIPKTEERQSLNKDSVHESPEPSTPSEDRYGYPTITPPEQWAKNMDNIFSELHNWAVKFALPHKSDLDELSRDEKTMIISSLEESCLEEPFETIISRIPSPANQAGPALFATMLLNKDVVEQFFSNPFWYISPDPLDPKPYITEVEELDDRFPTFGETLYRGFLTVSTKYAKEWRAQTINFHYNRLLGPNMENYLNPQIGKLEYWKWIAHSKMYSSDALRLLLPQPDKYRTKARVTLWKIYERAAELSMQVFLERPFAVRVY